MISTFKSSEKNSKSISRIYAIATARVKMSLSYKSSYLITLFLNLVVITMYFFFSKLNPDMKIFGISTSYFEFVFIGLALQFIVGTSLATVNGSIYNEIVSGTWSSLLLHFNFAEYAIGTTLAGTFLASFSIFIS
ncbi:MAG: hypothetical protein KAS47_07495, partial [Candidatus Heimdallarchaeota archaeon]|nr:hypothetical protein [Candidatus Heimdallarchaeota archaeon]